MQLSGFLASRARGSHYIILGNPGVTRSYPLHSSVYVVGTEWATPGLPTMNAASRYGMGHAWITEDDIELAMNGTEMNLIRRNGCAGRSASHLLFEHGINRVSQDIA